MIKTWLWQFVRRLWIVAEQKSKMRRSQVQHNATPTWAGAPPILWKWKGKYENMRLRARLRSKSVNRRHSRQEIADYFGRLRRKCRSGIYVLLFSNISTFVSRHFLHVSRWDWFGNVHKSWSRWGESVVFIREWWYSMCQFAKKIQRLISVEIVCT